MKTINLIGTGCTKNLFEYEPFKSNFRLKKCAHELSIWSSCDAPLGLHVDDIDKLDATPFNRKMVNYDLNNYALKDFETNKADYFMIDLMALSFAMYKVTYNGRTTYTQNQKIGSKLLPEMVKMPEFEGLSYEQVAFEDLPAEAMVTGFDNFCDWLIKNYPTNKIIICLPKRAKKYMLASDESIHSYSEEDLSANEVLDVIIQNFTEYIKSKFGSVIYLEFDDELLAYNKNSKDRIPAAYRYSEDDFIRLGKKLCQLLTGKAVDSAPDEYNKDSQNDNQKNNNSNNSAANDYSDIHSGSVNISRRTTTQRTVIIVMLLIMLVVAIMSFLK
ncbi:MAG: DUF6270 domain-containing protein [Lachnospiraceae bacterium]|nr:DUF6270 domain-containing protein [Lachnospiraceae bacterium]